jgi:peptidyl-prolyl cis-trans isomerase C
MIAVVNHVGRTPSSADGTGFLRRALRQPLLRFLVVGAAIFIASTALDRARETSSHTVVVDAQRVQRLAELHKVQMGALPSPGDLTYLVDSHIRDEILYREALKLGLDRDDEIIRRRLIQKMEFVQNDLAQIAEPTEAELRQYYTAHSAQFATAATTTFNHIYYSADSAGDDGAKRAATMQLANLDSTDPASGSGLGDTFPLQLSYADVDAQETAQIFGRSPFSTAVFNAPERRWSGPFRSGYGWHLVFVSKRVAPTVVDFDSAREQVREAYLDQLGRKANERSYAALKAQYNVLRSDGKAE